MNGYKLPIAAFSAGIGMVVWVYTYFYPRAEANQLRININRVEKFHRQDMTKVERYMKEIRDALRKQN